MVTQRSIAVHSAQSSLLLSRNQIAKLGPIHEAHCKLCLGHGIGLDPCVGVCFCFCFCYCLCCVGQLANE